MTTITATQSPAGTGIASTSTTPGTSAATTSMSMSTNTRKNTSSGTSTGTSTTSRGTLNNLMASSVAAFVSRLCTHPLDTLKTRVQVSNTPLPLLPTFVSLVKTGGLYRGLPIALTLSVPGLSVYLTAYDMSKDRISHLLPYLSTDSVANHLASAVVAEVLSGLFWTPMEVLKSKQQVENISSAKTSVSSSKASAPVSSKTASSRLHSTAASPKATVSSFSAATATTAAISTSASTSSAGATLLSTRRQPISTLDLARKIYQHEGLLGFYRGYFITLGVFVPYSMIYFATYEHLKEMAWRERHLISAQQRQPLHVAVERHNTPQEDALPFLTIMACAAVAAGIAGGVSNFVDVIKTRWQISVLATTEENSSTRRIISHMFKQGGLASFTRGMGARVLWMIPSVTISMSTFEWLKAHGFA